jgi:16S rRNA (uracil1498-N3)-methyltransferase
MDIGDRFLVSCQNRSDLCEIINCENDTVTAKIIEENFNNTNLPINIYLFQGLPKSDKMELIIQKCVELGVNEIVPVAMKRCVVKLDDKEAESKIKRYQAISESAAKQSNRSIIPEIKRVMSFKEAIEYAKGMDIAIVPYELCEGMDTFKKALSDITKGKTVGVFIGPEGGFEPTEISYALENGITPVSLGRRILRTETAGMTVMSIIMYHLEIQE